MNLVKLLTSPTATALGWTLVHAIWQGFAIVLPTAIALYLLRSRSSALRYHLGILALATQLLVSVVTFSFYYEPVVPSVSASAAQLVSASWQQNVGVLPWHQQVRQFLEGHLSQFVVLYLIGLVIFGLRLAGGWLYLQRLSRLATPPANTLWNTLVNQLRATMALRPVIQIRESASVAVPVVVGIMKPILLIPVGLATSLSVQEVEAVLAHELAHIKRQDYAVNLLQSLVDVLYFFHPALWWLSARVREERELCCDDLAVQACGGDGRRLAQALARMEELRLLQTAPTPALAMAFAKKRLQLLHRVRRMLGVPTRSIVSNRSLVGLTLATILLVSASVYAIQQQQPKPKAPKKTKSNTQRSEPIGGSELHFDEKRNIRYVTWKGKKLSASRVASLQRQWNQVMTGQLNLDDVNQPGRDILLSIIESDSALERQRLKRVTDDVQKTVSGGLADSSATNFEVYNSVFVNGKWTSPTKDTSATFKRQDTSRLTTLFQESVIQNALQNLDATERPMLIVPPSLFFDDREKRLQDYSASLFFDDKKSTARNKQNIDQKSQESKQGRIARLKAEAEQQQFIADAARQDTSRLSATLRQLESLSIQMRKIVAQQQPVLDRVSKETAELSLRHQELAKQLTPSRNNQLEQNQKIQELARLQARLIMEKALEIANKAIELESNMPTTANTTVKPSSTPTRTPRKPTAPTHRVIQGTVIKPTSPSHPPTVKPVIPQKPE